MRLATLDRRRVAEIGSVVFVIVVITAGLLLTISIAGTYTSTTTISTGYNYITGTNNVTTTLAHVEIQVNRGTIVCSIPFWLWLFERPSACK